MRVGTIAGEAEVDHAVATLVLAFGTDPVARWMYDDPRQYLRHIPRLFRALGASAFEAGTAERTNEGLGVALWLPPGIHGDDAPLEAVIAESTGGEKQAEVTAVFRADGALSANRAPLVPPRIPVVIEPAKCLSLREAWLRDLGHDPSGFVAFHLSHAAACALKLAGSGNADD
jgi:hypothetical protein